jgi:hypothetical protein
MAGNKRSGRRPAEPTEEAVTVAVRVWLGGTVRSEREAVLWGMQITDTKASERTIRRHFVDWLKSPCAPILYDQLVMEALASPGNGGMLGYSRKGKFGLRRRSSGDPLRDELANALQEPGSPKALAVERTAAVMASLDREVQRELRDFVATMDRLDAEAVVAAANRAKSGV